MCHNTVTMTTAAPTRPSARACVVCREPASGRSRYCGEACRKQASRLGKQPDQEALLPAWTAQVRERQKLIGQTIYECSQCEQRLLGERRCPDCNVMMKKLGLGGLCPECGELVLVSELLGW